MKDKGAPRSPNPGGGPYPEKSGSATAAPMAVPPTPFGLPKPIGTLVARATAALVRLVKAKWASHRQGRRGSDAKILGVGAPTGVRATRSAFILYPLSFILRKASALARSLPAALDRPRASTAGFFRLLAIFALIALPSGCSERVVIYHQFIQEGDCASKKMKTPDPSPAPPGERLVIFWDLPPEHRDASGKQLQLSVRYHNGQEEQQQFLLDGLSGRCQFQVRGDRYKETGGIASYRALLMVDSQLIEEWRHQVWVERIIATLP